MSQLTQLNELRKLVLRVQFPSIKTILQTILDHLDRLERRLEEVDARVAPAPAPRYDETKLEDLERQIQELREWVETTSSLAQALAAAQPDPLSEDERAELAALESSRENFTQTETNEGMNDDADDDSED